MMSESKLTVSSLGCIAARVCPSYSNFSIRCVCVCLLPAMLQQARSQYSARKFNETVQLCEQVRTAFK